jgi:hypothetical protein
MKTNSEKDADDIKYNTLRKRSIFNEVISRKMHLPIIVYVKNLEIPDITETVYSLHRFLMISHLIELVKKNLESEYKGNFCIKTELGETLLDDLYIEEAYEDFANNDKLLYLVFDVSD